MKIILLTLLLQFGLFKTIPIQDYMLAQPIQLTQNIHRIFVLHYHPSNVQKTHFPNLLQFLQNNQQNIIFATAFQYESTGMNYILDRKINPNYNFLGLSIDNVLETNIEVFLRQIVNYVKNLLNLTPLPSQKLQIFLISIYGQSFDYNTLDQIKALKDKYKQMTTYDMTIKVYQAYPPYYNNPNQGFLVKKIADYLGAPYLSIP